MEAGQAVQEDGTRVGHSHDLGGDTIRGELSDALGPDLVRLAHGDPHVGVDNVGTGDAVLDVGGQLDGAAVGLGDGLAGLDDVVGGHALLGAAGHEVHAELGADNHEGASNVVLAVAHEDEGLALDVVVEVLLDGQDVGEHLGGMPLSGQAVPHGHAGLSSELLDVVLGKAAELDAVIHATENAGGVLDGLLLAHLRRTRIEVGDAHAQIHAADLEGAAGTSGGLLEKQNDVLALEIAVRNASALHVLEVLGELEQVLDLLGGEVEELEEATAGEVNTHGSFPFEEMNYVSN